jgi:hypothetical protein
MYLTALTGFRFSSQGLAAQGRALPVVVQRPVGVDFDRHVRHCPALASACPYPHPYPYPYPTRTPTLAVVHPSAVRRSHRLSRATFAVVDRVGRQRRLSVRALDCLRDRARVSLHPDIPLACCTLSKRASCITAACIMHRCSVHVTVNVTIWPKPIQ